MSVYGLKKVKKLLTLYNDSVIIRSNKNERAPDGEGWKA